MWCRSGLCRSEFGPRAILEAASPKKEVRVARTQRGKRKQSERPAHDDLTVVVCRGGDCGSRRKHPGTDHQAQLSALRSIARPGTRVLVSKCLDACDHSNVVVVAPGADGVAQGEGAVWIGEANDADTTTEIVRGVDEGGPGVPEMPVLVEIARFWPTRQSRRTLDSQHLR